MARIQSRWLPIQERARAGGLIWLSARFGAAFAPLIFGNITRGISGWQASVGESGIAGWLSAIPSWRIAFFASGALGVLWCLAFYPWFRDEPTEKESVGAAELRYIKEGRGPIEGSHRVDAHVWRDLFSSPSLWAMATYYICGSFGWSFFVSWMPLYMKEVQGVAFENSEWSSAFPLMCGGIACLAGGILSDALVKRTGRRWFGRAIFPVSGCLVAALAMLAMPYAQTASSATILMCIAAAAFDFGQAANVASIVDIGGRNAGIAMGFINTFGCLGNSAQPYIGARVFESFGWGPLFGVYAIAFLLASTCWALIDPTKTFYGKRHDTPGDTDQ